MPKNIQKKPRFLNLTHYTWTLLTVWTIIVAGLIAMEYRDINDYTRELAVSTARANLNKDKSFRYWGTALGGVYVPITSTTPPNPILSMLKERDIVTPSGKHLTLMNPEYMVRHMNETFSELYGVSGHITSLKPLRPENGPDQWEEKALQSFEDGNKEMIEITKDDEGDPIIRLMEPLFVKGGCLKCHGHQGYKIGDIRGGVGISLPIDNLTIHSDRQLLLHGVSLVILWLIGCIVISLGSQRLKRQTLELAVSNIELFNEIEERKKTEILLQKEITFTAAVQDTAGALIMVLDTDGKIIRFNKTCEKISGHPLKEAQGQYFWDLLLPESERANTKRQFKEVMKTETTYHYATTLLTKGKQTRIIEWANTTFWNPTGDIEYVISTGIDITKAQQLQSQLLQAEKLTAVGKLSASIAHEINNPLFGIRNVLERLKEKANLNEDNADFAHLAIQECDRIKNLIVDLQGFNRPTSGVMTPVNINNILGNMLLLSKKEMENKNIKVDTYLCTELCNIQAITDQIKQVILNLLNNAIEAMPNGGTITITTAKSSDQKTVNLTIADTGAGINKKDLEHIFEPFFTTKSAVKGTGLGLSVSYGIMKRHGGEIFVKSTPKQGTQFTISLPVERARP